MRYIVEFTKRDGDTIFFLGGLLWGYKTNTFCFLAGNGTP